MRKAAAWSVHFYNGCGGLIGMMALLTAAAGDIRATFGLLVITMIIDGTDGILARRVRVRDVLPKFDGASLDKTRWNAIVRDLPAVLSVEVQMLP